MSQKMGYSPGIGREVEYPNVKKRVRDDHYTKRVSTASPATILWKARKNLYEVGPWLESGNSDFMRVLPTVN